jgi:aconitate hydratase
VVAIKVGDKITTDHIMPAGARLKYRSNIPAYSAFVFEGVDAEFARRAGAARDRGLHNLIVAGSSYGQGSSREHAALCPMYLGVKAVLAKSIERIHRANLINFGIVPLTFADPADYERIGAGEEWQVDEVCRVIESGAGELCLVGPAGTAPIRAILELTARQRAIVLSGGLLNYTRNSGRR